MQIFFEIILVVSMLIGAFCFSAMYFAYCSSRREESKNKETFLKHINELKMMVDKLKEEVIYSNTRSHQHYTDIKDRMDVLGHIVDRLAETKEPAPKTNNWDSMRAAFRVPTKVEVNERN
jgi:hypothetical protein